MNENKQPWHIAIIIAVGIGCLLYFLFEGWAYDDPYITLRYAENLSKGIGFVYNPGEKILSTTSPFFAVISAFLHNNWLELPRLAVLIGIISIPLGGLFLWDLGHTCGKPIVGWLGLLFYPMFPLLLNTLSSETPLYLLFCLGTFSWYARKRYNLTAVFCALAILTRPDGVLVAAILATHYLVCRRQSIPWRAVTLFMVITVSWILFATLYFGSPIPVTLTAKQQQGAMAISQKFAPGIMTILGWGYSSRIQYWFIAGFAILGAFSIPKRNREWAVLISWPVLYFTTFSLLGVSRYFWYYVPLIPGIIVAAALGAKSLHVFFLQRFPRHHNPINLLSIGIIILFLFLQFEHLFYLSNHPDKRVKIYQAVGEWINANTGEDESVGTLEVGIMGFFSKRHMIDFAGIIQPEIALQLSPNATYEDSAIWATQRYQPDYLILKPTWFPQLMEDFVSPYCQAQKNFQGESYGYIGNLTIYQCDWSESIINTTSSQD